VSRGSLMMDLVGAIPRKLPCAVQTGQFALAAPPAPSS